jgi:hypothetical protein
MTFEKTNNRRREAVDIKIIRLPLATTLRDRLQKEK